jgi:hypothetical protein
MCVSSGDSRAALRSGPQKVGELKDVPVQWRYKDGMGISLARAGERDKDFWVHQEVMVLKDLVFKYL